MAAWKCHSLCGGLLEIVSVALPTVRLALNSCVGSRGRILSHFSLWYGIERRRPDLVINQ